MNRRGFVGRIAGTIGALCGLGAAKAAEPEVVFPTHTIDFTPAECTAKTFAVWVKNDDTIKAGQVVYWNECDQKFVAKTW